MKKTTTAATGREGLPCTSARSAAPDASARAWLAVASVALGIFTLMLASALVWSTRRAPPVRTIP